MLVGPGGRNLGGEDIAVKERGRGTQVHWILALVIEPNDTESLCAELPCWYRRKVVRDRRQMGMSGVRDWSWVQGAKTRGGRKGS